jgi:hypothetical protein
LLAAAAVLAIARLSAGVIIDDDGASWTDAGPDVEQPPEAFAARVRLDTPQTDLLEAARLFYERTIEAQWNKRERSTDVTPPASRVRGTP